MSGLLRTIARRAAPVLRGHTVTRRANIYTAPAEEKIGTVETIIAMSCFMCILVPSGWILVHLEDYRNKE